MPGTRALMARRARPDLDKPGEDSEFSPFLHPHICYTESQHHFIFPCSSLRTPDIHF